MDKHLARYASVSSARQVAEGTIAAPRASLHASGEAHGVTVETDGIGTDDGVRGATLARPALDALRDQAGAGAMEAGLVLSPDRLARTHAHQLVLLEALQRFGVEMVCVHRPIAHAPEEQWLLQRQGVIAAFERAKSIERRRRGHLHPAKHGQARVLAGAPDGDVDLPVREAGQARDAMHPADAETVRRLFTLSVADGLSMAASARPLTAARMPTRRGAPQGERSVVWGLWRHLASRGQAADRTTPAVPRPRATKHANDHGDDPQHVNASSRQRPREAWRLLDVPRLRSPGFFARAGRQLEANNKRSPRNNKRDPSLLSGL